MISSKPLTLDLKLQNLKPESQQAANPKSLALRRACNPCGEKRVLLTPNPQTQDLMAIV